MGDCSQASVEKAAKQLHDGQANEASNTILDCVKDAWTEDKKVGKKFLEDIVSKQHRYPQLSLDLTYYPNGSLESFKIHK